MQDFPCKLIRKNHQKTLPSRVLYFDTETRTQREGIITKHRMDIAWSCFTRYNKNGDEIVSKWTFHNSPYLFCEYITELTQHKKTLYIMTHNAFFDLQVSDFFYYFTKWGWILDFYYEQGLTYILCIRKEDKTIKVVSTTNFFDTSVKALGKMLNLPKLDVTFGDVTPEDLSKYCKRDVEIIKKAMEFYYAFLREHDLGKFCMTKASQAMHAFRHRFMYSKIYIHENQEIKDFERLAYFGGRTECFFIGEPEGGPFVSLDVNSMYPYCMKNYFVPTKLVNYRENVPLDLAEDILKTFCVVAEVDINTDVPIYCTRDHGKLIFPIGRFKAHLCTEGLKIALQRGHALQIRRLAVYQRAKIFDDYIDYFYYLKSEYKKQGDKIMERMSKLFLNSLYGKFAQKIAIEDQQEDVTFDGYFRRETLDLVTGKTEIEYKLMNKRVVLWGEEDGKNSFTAISAHITETARLVLWKIVEDIGYDNVLYCDTDSVKIRQSALHNLTYPLDKLKLGALDVEEKFEYFNIKGPKSYETEHIRKLKGVPSKAEQINDNTFKYPSFLGQKSHMQKQITRFFIMRDTVKTVGSTYDKGVVLPNGKVEPIELNEF